MSAKSLRVASPPAERPVLLYDGGCRFCKMWVDRWNDHWSDRLDFEPGQAMRERFPEIPPASYDEAVQLVETDGRVTSGAHAVFRARAIGRGRPGAMLRLYERVPPVAAVLEFGYRQVARNRGHLFPLTRWLNGPDILKPTFGTGTAVFLRALAAIYLIAFVSLWVQLPGLVGPDGILPAQQFFDAVEKQVGGDRWWLLPTLCWVFGGGVFLHVLCLGGVALSIAAFMRYAQPVCLALLWLFYLSLCAAGQLFFNFQWDTLLLEAGLLAVLAAPWEFRRRERTEPPPLARWLIWWLMFRLMFMSGLVKLTSGDKSWLDFTALLYHYQTQPLPTSIGWWMHQMPEWFHKLSCVAMFAIELGAPFLLFTTRRLRRIAALSLVALQVLIALTGNYTFFNLLTVALCAPFLDDTWWSRWFGVLPALRTDTKRGRYLPKWFLIPAAGVLFSASVVVTLPSLLREVRWPEWYGSFYQICGATRSVNSYGLFRVMTKSRPELVFEGSDDGRTWLPYEFGHKPGDLKRAPGFVAPHQPRLDWQLWFAALDFPRRQPWVERVVEQLLRGSAPVTAFLDHNPFPDKPPRFVRVVVYDYAFTSPAERSRSGQWWRREPIDYYYRSVSLKR